MTGTSSPAAGVVVRCPSCGARLRLQQTAAELPNRFKVRCSGCGKPFLVRRREEAAGAGSPLDQTLHGAPMPAGDGATQASLTPTLRDQPAPARAAAPAASTASAPARVAPPPSPAAAPPPAPAPRPVAAPPAPRPVAAAPASSTVAAAPASSPVAVAPASPPGAAAPAASRPPAPQPAAVPPPRPAAPAPTPSVLRASLPTTTLESRPHAVGQTFAAGETVAERYRIVRFIAKGGMGEVYEAFDTALGEPVALKTVRPDVAADETALERFKREIQLARQVTHHNVCRIHDLGAHRSDSPLAALYPRGEILFVTMELLRGESLADRLAREGALSEAQALPLVRQMAAALDAAHAAGIVHRDFKCANVVLEPQEAAAPQLTFGRERDAAAAEAGGVRVVVTDFGLARGRQGEAAGTLTVAGAVMGSPAYMAPEQVDGSGATAAVDIYALGVVLFEMTTGALPFKGDSPLSTAVKRLNEAPPRPTAVKAGIDPDWEAAILRCLERKPENRFGSAADVVAALDPSPLAAALGTSKLTRRRLWTAVAAGFLVALALVTIFSVWRQRAARDEARIEVPTAARPSVALLGLKNSTGDPQLAWLSSGLPEMLGSELSGGGAVRLIPGENVTRAQVELGLQPGDTWGSDTLERVRKNLGSDYLVTGAFTAIGEGPQAQLRLDLRLQDTMSSGASTGVAVSGPREAIFQLVGQAGAKLRAALHVEGGGGAWKASNPEAVRLYTQGLEHLRGFDARGARELLEQSVAADPRDARAHSALASALAALGYVEKAKEAARQAVDLSASLPDAERQEIRAQYLEVSGDWAGAARAWEQLWRRQTDDLEYGLKLAQALTAAGEPSRALEVATTLKHLPSVAADDVRIYFAQAAAAGALGQARQQQEAAAKAAQVAGAQGARLLRARALLLQGWALRNLGDAEKAQGVTAEAEGLFQQAGDASGVAKARVQRASLLYDQGDLATAKSTFEKALATYRELGDKGNEAQALNNLAVVLKQQGDIDAAIRLYQQSQQLSAETGNRIGVALAENNIGAIELKRGDLSGALAAFQRSLALAKQVDDQGQQASALYNSAVTLRKLGRLAEAEAMHRQALELRRKLARRLDEAASLTDLAAVQCDRGDIQGAAKTYEQALQLARTTGNRHFEAYALSGLGQVKLQAGDLDGAQQLAGQALRLRQDLGEQGTMAESRLALATVALERSQFGEAESLAAAAEQRFQADGALDLLAGARAVRARSLLFLRRQPEALQMVDEAMARAAKSEDLRTRCEVSLARARVLAGSGGSAVEADRLAVETATAAQGAGLVPMLLEAQLLQGQLARENGQEQRGAAMVAAVRQQAERAGLGLLAKKASG